VVATVVEVVVAEEDTDEEEAVVVDEEEAEGVTGGKVEAVCYHPLCFGFRGKRFG
jgi:hypothetical protein